MTVTMTSLLSCLPSSALLTVLAWVIIKYDSSLRVMGRYICVLLTAIIVRILLPVEFGFTITLFSRHLLTGLRDFMFSGLRLGGCYLSVGQILLAMWIAGAVCSIFIRIREYVHSIHIIEKCPGYFKHDVATIIRRINSECGKEGKFCVLLVPGIQSPSIFGLVKPKILMPGGDYTEEEIYYILKHEMLHYYQHDMLVKILCEVFCAVYWWNPAVFVLKKLVARVVEIRVDCLLTAGFSEEEKIRYLQCIVKSMRSGMQERTSLMITFAAQRGEAMMQRFGCIWENHWAEKGRKGLFIAVSSCLLFMASMLFVVEPWYEVDIPGTFEYPDSETSYLLEQDGYYEVYVEDEFVGKVLEIAEPLTRLKIYEEDLKNEE